MKTRALTLALTLLPAGAAMSQVPLDEREALISLYEDTKGAGWTDSTGWLGPAGTECTWAGVTCLGETTRGPAVPDHVAQIYLKGNLLDGTIPAELGWLDELDYLNLMGNRLQGPIPIELTDLGNLTYLSLAANQLIGAIPEEVKRLTRLETLILGNNQLTGPLPLGLTEIGSLTLVSLAGNRLSGPIPPELADLTALSALSLADNGFSGTVPPEIGSLDQLQYLYLEDNRLSGPLPVELGDLDLVESGENSGGLRLCRNSFTSSQNLASYLDQFHDGSWQDCQSFEGKGIFWDDFEKGLIWSTP